MSRAREEPVLLRRDVLDRQQCLLHRSWVCVVAVVQEQFSCRAGISTTAISPHRAFGCAESRAGVSRAMPHVVAAATAAAAARAKWLPSNCSCTSCIPAGVVRVKRVLAASPVRLLYTELIGYSLTTSRDSTPRLAVYSL
jgi:hypothetical protein